MEVTFINVSSSHAAASFIFGVDCEYKKRKKTQNNNFNSYLIILKVKGSGWDNVKHNRKFIKKNKNCILNYRLVYL